MHRRRMRAHCSDIIIMTLIERQLGSGWDLGALPLAAADRLQRSLNASEKLETRKHFKKSPQVSVVVEALEGCFTANKRGC